MTQRKIKSALLISVLLSTAGFSTKSAIASDALKGDADAGAAKAVTCSACHGADGNSVNPQWPSIAGQNERYVFETLKDFKDGTRQDVLMSSQAMILSDQDMADLAAFYAKQTPTRRTADSGLADAGERLYRGGDKGRTVSACIACHGPTGRGNAPAGYPSLTGQHATYTAKQLVDYKSGKRTSDGDTQIMRNITALLSQEQIDAVAAYIQGLR